MSGKYHHFDTIAMYQEALQDLGLSQTEAKIYEALIEMGPSSIPALSLKIQVHRRNVYDVMPKLLKKGLVYQIVESKESVFAPVEPGKLNDLIVERQSRLDEILPALTAQFKKTATNEAVYVYHGKEGFKNYLRDILRVGEDVYFVGAKGGWFDPELQVFVRHFLKKAQEKKIQYRHIFDAEVKTFAPDLLKALGKPYKFFPKKYSTTGAIDIFGDHIVTFSGLTLKQITDDVALTVIVNKELADCYRTWFQFMWDSLS